MFRDVVELEFPERAMSPVDKDVEVGLTDTLGVAVASSVLEDVSASNVDVGTTDVMSTTLTVLDTVGSPGEVILLL